MSLLTSASIGWGEKLAVITNFNLTDEQATLVFGVSEDELNTARSMAERGVFKPPATIDFGAYDEEIRNALAANGDSDTTEPDTITLGTVEPTAPIEFVDAQDKPMTRTDSESLHEKPVTATKPQKVPKKRGRKGDKIITAFKAVPAEPTDAEAFAKQHNVSMAVLRQARRFDNTGLEGTVKVKKDKSAGILTIWREAPSA